jgi:hypothetical protein
MARLRKDTILTARIPREEFTIKGHGDVLIRGLSRVEALQLPDEEVAKEARLLSIGIVEPAFTVAEIRQWMADSVAGELQDVSQRIAQLSGMLADAGKSDLPGDGDGPDAGVRALPGAEVGPDGDGAPGEPDTA